MGRSRRFGPAPIASATITILLLMRVAALAQDVTGPALKAAFIYNFVRFTEWPHVLPVSEPFVMCVLGDADISEALSRTIRGRELAGHRMVVSHAATAPPPGCHVLYVSGMAAAQAAEVVATLRNAPVLTIGDSEGFIERGGIAQFFFEHGQLRFRIGIEAARRARLQISSKLLALSKR